MKPPNLYSFVQICVFLTILGQACSRLIPGKTPTLFMPVRCQNFSFMGFYGINVVSQEGTTYRPSFGCSVTVALSRYSKANISIPKFDLEPMSQGICKDYVNIFDDVTGRSLTGKFCGKDPPFTQQVFDTYRIKVHFKTNNNRIEGTGFRIEIRRVFVGAGGNSGNSGGSINGGTNGGSNQNSNGSTSKGSKINKVSQLTLVVTILVSVGMKIIFPWTG